MFQKKDFFRLFWPVLIEQILATAIGMVNTMMVSGVGISAISAVSIVDSLNFVIMNLFISFSTGATVVVAQSIGAKDPEKANETASQSMTACVATALLSGLFFIAFGYQIINLLFGQADMAVKSNAMVYLVFSGISYPFLAIYSMAAGILRASSNAKTPMRASIITNIVNIGVGSLCIFILKMGVEGAGVALLVSRITGAVILFSVLHRSVEGVSIRKISLKIKKEIIGPVLKIGLPACIDGFIFNGGKLLIQTLVTSLGTTALAANGIASSITGFICVPGNTISIVAVTIVGQAVGAGIFNKELKKIIGSLISIATVLLGVLTVVMFPIMPVFVNLYTPPAEVKSMVLSILNMALIFMPFTWPAAFVLPSCIRSTGDSLFVTVASVLSMWFVRVMGAWIFINYFGWGIMGVWLFWCMDWVARGIVFVIRTLQSPYINRISPETRVETAQSLPCSK